MHVLYMQTFINTFVFAYRHLFSVLFSSVSRYLVLGHGCFIKFSLKTQVYMHIDQSCLRSRLLLYNKQNGSLAIGASKDDRKVDSCIQFYSLFLFFLNIKFISWSWKITVEFGGGGGQTQGKQKRSKGKLNSHNHGNPNP